MDFKFANSNGVSLVNNQAPINFYVRTFMVKHLSGIVRCVLISGFLSFCYQVTGGAFR